MTAPPASRHRSLIVSLVSIVAGMTLLAFASVPLYRLFCQATGYGGTPMKAESAPDKIYAREMTVRFNADIEPDLAWEFTPIDKKVDVRIGEQKIVQYRAKNISNVPVTGRAIFNVTPVTAAQYFVKIACFCFENQTLQPQEEVTMPVSFFIDPKIMTDPDQDTVKTMTLSYTFFAVK